jgi:hypothetical protein
MGQQDPEKLALSLYEENSKGEAPNEHRRYRGAFSVSETLLKAYFML